MKRPSCCRALVRFEGLTNAPLGVLGAFLATAAAGQPSTDAEANPLHPFSLRSLLVLLVVWIAAAAGVAVRRRRPAPRALAAESAAPTADDRRVVDPPEPPVRELGDRRADPPTTVRAPATAESSFGPTAAGSDEPRKNTMNEDLSLRDSGQRP